nr:DUF4982 domain-containing protein [Pedobacter aquae]
MVHIYGHTWPVRWGAAGEEKMIKVFSNCDEAELFVNGKSQGVKKRNSQDFPAAGLRWNVVPNAGKNTVKVIAKKGKTVLEDELSFDYETRPWGKPAKLVLQKIAEENGKATFEVKLKDANGVQCLDARNWVRFSLAGDGELIDNQGTSTGSRYVQFYNGRALISVKTNGGKSTIAVKSEGVPSEMLAF